MPPATSPVELVQALAPLQIADPVHRIVGARDLPALDVLAARGETHDLRRVRREPVEHRRLRSA